MTETDIITIELTPEMVTEAKKVHQERLIHKQSDKTRLAITNHGVYGELGHMAVEQAFEELGLYYESTRTIRYNGGDPYDVKYENDTIDVKATHGVIDNWYYNKEFLVFQAQLDDPKIELVTHFCFVVVNPDLTEAYIFGIIDVNDFLHNSYPVKLKWDNQGIRANKLRPFRNYAFRVR
jgi:hypothetical protein